MNLSNITVNKQSSIRIAGEKVLYFDAFEIENEAHDADLIFVTHEHYDHFDPASIAKVMKADSVIVAPESMKNKLLKELAVSEDQCVFCNPGESINQAGLQITAVYAYNKLKPFHAKMNKWLGYLVRMDEVTYYVAGDTDANEEVKKVRCDVALVPIGGHFTMDKKQAAELIAQMKPKAAIPTHYGSIVGNAKDGENFMSLLAKAAPEVQVELKL